MTCGAAPRNVRTMPAGEASSVHTARVVVAPERRTRVSVSWPWSRRAAPAPDKFDAMPYIRDDCIFCKIVAGTIPAREVHRDEHAIAFRDINPQAPTHILLVPTTHYEDAVELATNDPPGLAALVVTGRALALSEGIADSGYRLVFNTGPDAGQSVFHAHLHLLGGRAMTWPPG
jgi:histidine triad (HIT) family protein